jgi:hypothetical protein
MLLLPVGWPYLPRRLLAANRNGAIPQSEPFCDLLRIEANRSSNMKTRQRATGRHPVNVFVVNAKKLTEF